MVDMDDYRDLLDRKSDKLVVLHDFDSGKMQIDVNLQQMKQKMKPHGKLITI